MPDVVFSKKLESLRQCGDKLLKEAKEAKELISNFDISPKVQSSFTQDLIMMLKMNIQNKCVTLSSGSDLKS